VLHVPKREAEFPVKTVLAQVYFAVPLFAATVKLLTFMPLHLPSGEQPRVAAVEPDDVPVMLLKNTFCIRTFEGLESHALLLVS